MGNRITRLIRDNNKDFRHVNMFLPIGTTTRAPRWNKRFVPRILSEGLSSEPPHELLGADLWESGGIMQAFSERDAFSVKAYRGVRGPQCRRGQRRRKLILAAEALRRFIEAACAGRSGERSQPLWRAANAQAPPPGSGEPSVWLALPSVPRPRE